MPPKRMTLVLIDFKLYTKYTRYFPTLLETADKSLVLRPVLDLKAIGD